MTTLKLSSMAHGLNYLPEYVARGNGIFTANGIEVPDTLHDPWDGIMHALADGGLETVVWDDAEPERRRRSLEGIEERVKQLHGAIEVGAEGSGTRISVTLPPYATRR